EADKILIENSSFSLRELINDVVFLFDISAKQKNIKLSLHMDQDIPDLVVGDSVRLRQVLSNIVGNAVKFTTKGYVDIKISSENVTDKSLKLSFDVKDSGIGIPEEQRAYLYGRFNQLDSS
ncbi:MAG: ATP-binding protein, partial [Proteobacteria bacterium]|nr:ATP-binding protein [Pseudomonadota bacterium]